MWIWKKVNISNEGIWMANAIIKETALLICDGSYQPKLSQDIGAAAWIVECTNTKAQAWGMVRSTTTQSSSYRSELMGLYSALALISAVCELHRVKEGSVIVGCDN